MTYAAKFYSNFGNYTSNKKKFFPSIKIEDFEAILDSSTNFKDTKSIWDIIKYIIYDKSENVLNINLEEKNGKNCYYFGGIKKDTDDFLTKLNIQKEQSEIKRDKATLFK